MSTAFILRNQIPDLLFSLQRNNGHGRSGRSGESDQEMGRGDVHIIEDQRTVADPEEISGL